MLKRKRNALMADVNRGLKNNAYVLGSGIGAVTRFAYQAYLKRVACIEPKIPIVSTSLFYSKNNVTDGGFTVGYIPTKDMSNDDYTSEFNPNNYYPTFFPNMAPFINENIVLGDKNEEDRLTASYWDDLGNDIFDDWGFFYLYDVTSGKYYFPLITPQNGEDGAFFTQTFNAFGRTFTVTHGWAVQGIFKFDISVADGLPFKFGAYGDMGSDGDEITEELTHNYSINGENFTLYYHRDKEDGDDQEQLYSYWIPKKVSENSTKTYNVYYDDEDMSMLSKDVTTGLIVYFAKTYDVKEWVINDIGISS
jgi:hypothetical protein